MTLTPIPSPRSSIDRAERRKKQNRLAQRNHRKLVKQKVDTYDNIMKMFESSRTDSHHHLPHQNTGFELPDLQDENMGVLPMKPLDPTSPTTTRLHDEDDVDIEESGSDNAPAAPIFPVSEVDNYMFVFANEPCSPLHEAVLKGDLDILRLLIEHGAQVNLKDNSGSTPLHVASRMGDERILALLLRHVDVAQMGITNAEGLTPLRLAIRNGHIGIVKMLLDAGADVNGRP